MLLRNNMATKQDKLNDIFMEKLDLLQDKLNEVSIKLAGLPDEMATKFDNRYASKRTELAVDRLGWLVITAVIGAILALVFK